MPAPIPNLYESRQAELRTAPIVTGVLAAFFVGLRIITRTKFGVGLGVDDYMLLVGMVFLVGDIVGHFLLLRFGMGLHYGAVPPAHLVTLSKVFMAIECVYTVNLVIIKLSLLLMYKRIFPVRPLKIGAYVLGGITVAWGIGVTLASLLQCVPIRKTWEPLTPGHCIDTNAFYYGNAIPNILVDALILCLPIPFVWKLQASLLRRLSLCLVFLMGAFVVFTSIYRFTTLFKINVHDFTWTVSDAITWSVIECAMGVISACLPTLGPLFLKASSILSSRFGTAGPPRQLELRADLVTVGGHIYADGSGHKYSQGSDKSKLRSLGDRMWKQYNAETIIESRVSRSGGRSSEDEDLERGREGHGGRPSVNQSSDEIPLQGIAVAK